MEKQNNEKLASKDPAGAKYFSTLLKGLDEQTKLAITQRTHGILTSGNDSLIKTELLQPLQEATQNTGGLGEERKLQQDNLIKRLSQAVDTATAGLQQQTATAAGSVAQQDTKTGFFTEEQLRAATKVEYLDPATGAVVQSQRPFSLTSPAGIVNQQLVLSRGGGARTGTLYDLDTLKAKSNDGIPFWKEVSTAISTRSNRLVNPFVKRFLEAENWAQDVNLVTALLSQHVNDKFFNFLLNNNIFFPFTVLVARPWVCLRTCCVIIGTGGKAMGAMYIKDPDVLKGTDVTGKMHEWHLNIWAKAFVHQTNLISVFDDVAMKSYRGGGSLRWVSKADCDAMQQQRWIVPRNDVRGSLFALLCGYDENNQLPEMINFKSKRRTPQGEPYVAILDNPNFKNFLNGTGNNAHPMKTWVEQQQNSLCWQGTQLLYNPYKGNFSCVIYSNNNHFGPNMYSGMMHDLRTMNLILKDQGYNDTSKYTQFFSM
jgi:hypothetical protein